MSSVFVAVDLCNMNGAACKLWHDDCKIIQLDYEKLVNFTAPGKVIAEKRIYIPRDIEGRDEGFIFILKKIGFTVVTKKPKVIKSRYDESYIKANFDVEIACDVCLALPNRVWDEVLLFSGDSDFEYLIDILKMAGIKVTVISSQGTLSTELRSKADNIIFLDDIIAEVRKLA